MTTRMDDGTGSDAGPTLLPVPPSPRQFALVLDENDLDYEDFVQCVRPTSRVLWWGTALDDAVLLYTFGEQGGLSTAHCASVASAIRMISRIGPCKLVWL